jgi:hypothetical protein
MTWKLRVVGSLLLVSLSGASVAGPAENEALAYSAYRHANYAAALRLFLSLANQGGADARGTLGFMYANGQGVTQNYSEAVRWYRLAADQGRAYAQFNLGILYTNGQGVPQNYSEAAKLFRLAADQGRADAQYNLGIMYYNGQGVSRDFVRAHMLFSLSAAQGFKDGFKFRDAVAQLMTPTQIGEAQKLAHDRKKQSTKLQTQATAKEQAFSTPPLSATLDLASDGVIFAGNSVNRLYAGDQPALAGLHDSHGHYIGPREEEVGAFSPVLEARSRAMFGYGNVNSERQRQQWMAEQEQQAIANDINRSKPLIYPVNGR